MQYLSHTFRTFRIAYNCWHMHNQKGKTSTLGVKIRPIFSDVAWRVKVTTTKYYEYYFKSKTFTYLLAFLDYQRLACQDTAYEPDCKLKASQGLCNTYLQNGYPVYSFCQKSCGRCNPYLTCDNCGTNTCNGGTCIQTNVFTIPTIQCICKPDRGGTYCQSSTWLF